jgi:hypothetical protein
MSTAQQPAEVQPLEKILVKGPDFTNIRSDSMTLLVNTSIPVVCAAAYGTSTQYGKLAADADMAGGPHTNHHPILTGMQPDTKYHVRVQGVGPDGTLYRSKDYTVLTAPELPAARPQGENLALMSRGGRVSGVSSNFGGGDNNSEFGANHAIDGDSGRQWSSNGDGDKAWIEIELAAKTHVTAVGFWSRSMGSTGEIRSFRVVTDNGKAYGPYKLADAAAIHYFDTDFTTKKLRFEAVQTTGGNTGAVEIQVYGQAEP